MKTLFNYCLIQSAYLYTISIYIYIYLCVFDQKNHFLCHFIGRDALGINRYFNGAKRLEGDWFLKLQPIDQTRSSRVARKGYLFENGQHTRASGKNCDKQKKMSSPTGFTSVDASLVNFAKLSMEDVLDDEKGRQFLKQFMRKCSIPETLTFLEMVEEYTLLKSHSNRFKKAQEIVDKFIQQRARSEINISQTTRTKIMQAIQRSSPSNCEKRIFDDCLTEVMLELKNDVWPRFLNSEEAKQLMGLSNVDGDTANEEDHTKKIGFDLSCPYLSEREFELIKEWGFSETKIAGTQWKKVSEREGVKAFATKRSVKVSSSDKETKMWRIEGFFQEPPEIVMKAAYTTSLRLQHDGYLTDSKHLLYSPYNYESNQYAYTICCERYKFPFMKNRVLTFSGTIRQESFSSKKWQRFVIFRKTIKNISLQDVEFCKSGNYVSSECVGAAIFEQANDSNSLTRWIEIGWMDIKGSVPKWLWNKMVQGRGTAFYDGIKRMISEYKSLIKDPSFVDDKSDHLLETLKENQEKKGIIHYE
jgi:hypothetical protein